jgi:hypothetical protein
MFMHPNMRLMYEKLAQHKPEIMRQFWPRNIVPPSSNYCNPRLYAAQATGISLLGMRQDGVQGGMAMCVERFAIEKAPTFFIAPHFLRAVACTDLEEDFAFDKITWPFDTMLLCLPITDIEEILGRSVPWILVSKLNAGRWWAPITQCDILMKEDRFATHFPAFPVRDGGTDWMPEDFGGSWPLEGVTVQKLLQSVEFRNHSVDVKDIPGMPPIESMPADAGAKLHQRVVELSILLLLGMVACPEYIEMGEVVRPARHRAHGRKSISELWSPNVVGRIFAPPNIIDPPGHHASPRTHRRRGHFRRVSIGPRGATTIEVRWIKPTGVNLKK